MKGPYLTSRSSWRM